VGRKSKARRKEKRGEKSWTPLAFLNSKANWFIVLIVVLPLLQTVETIDGNIAIRFLAQGIFIVGYVIYFFFVRKNKIRWHYPRIVTLVFVSSLLYFFWSATAMLWATNVAETIYDTSRYGLNLMLMLLTMQAFLEENFNWSRFLKSIVWISSLHCLIGFDQYFEWNLTNYIGVAMPSGAMINRNLFGSFLSLFVPLVMYGMLTQKSDKRLLHFVAFVLLIAALFISQTRSAWVASILAFILTSAFVGIYLPAKRRLLLSAIGVTIACISLLVVANTVLGVKTDADFNTLKNRKSIHSQTSDNGSQKTGNSKKENNSIEERLIVWEETSRMISDYPLRGVAPGNWKIHVPNYQKSETRMQEGQIVRVRPHNIYLLVLSETGVVGFLLFYLPWVLIAIMGFKMILYDNDQNRKLLVILLLATQVSLAADGFFSFPTERIEHSIILILTMGATLGLYGRFRKSERDEHPFLGMRWLLIPMISLIGWSIFLGYEKYEFEYRMKRARQLYVNKKYDRVLREVEMGKSKFVNLEINLDPIELVEALALNVLKRSQEGLKAIEMAESYNPYSTRIISTRGNFHTALKQHDLAIISYKRALEFSPNHLVSIKNMALNYYFMKDYAACLEVLDQISLDDDKTFQGLYESASKKLKLEEGNE